MNHIITHLLRVHGRVQGVGFRNYIYGEAQRRSVTGWVRNCPDGTVEAMLQGKPPDVGAVEAACRKGPAFANVDHVERFPVDPDVNYETFQIRS